MLKLIITLSAVTADISSDVPGWKKKIPFTYWIDGKNDWGAKYGFDKIILKNRWDKRIVTYRKGEALSTKN